MSELMKKIIAFGLCLFLQAIVITVQHNTEATLFHLPDDFWKVYISLSEDNLDMEGREKNGFQDNGKDYINYYVMASQAVEDIYKAKVYGDHSLITEAREILRSIMATYDAYESFPRPPYQGLEYGWVTSMDAPVIMLASELMYEYTGEPIYRTFSLKLMPYCFKSVDEGGFNLELEDEAIWPLEYAWKNVTEDTAKFVLNGSLLGYVSLKALSNIYRDDNLDAYLTAVERGYNSKIAEFHKGNYWSYYMLNPKTVIPIHYMIFEEKLFQAAFMLSGNQLFKKELTYRTNCLKDVLKVQFYKDDDAVSYYMIRASSPNPYQIDTYTTTIDFLDEHGDILSSRTIRGSGAMAERKEEFYNSMFAIDRLDNPIPKTYQVYAGEGIDKYLLFESSVGIEETIPDIAVDYSISLARDARFVEETNERIVRLEKERDEKAEGDIIYRFSIPRKANGKEIYVMEIGNLSNSNISIGLLAYDTNSAGYGRYYTNLQPGMNAVSFTLDGFVDSEKLEDLESIWLRVYDQDMDTDETMLYAGDLKVFNDNRKYAQYMKKYNFLIQPQ